MNLLHEKNHWEECIETCLDCYRVCEETISHCLTKGGQHAARYHIQLLADCVKLCKLCADFMIRNSPYAKRIAELCADICKKCEEHCAEFTDDEQMLNCSDVCRQCALVCREMIETEQPASSK